MTNAQRSLQYSGNGYSSGRRSIAGHKGWKKAARTVFVFDKKKKLIAQHEGANAAAVAFNVSYTAIRNCIKSQRMFDGKYFSYSPDIVKFY